MNDDIHWLRLRLDLRLASEVEPWTAEAAGTGDIWGKFSVFVGGLKIATGLAWKPPLLTAAPHSYSVLCDMFLASFYAVDFEMAFCQDGWEGQYVKDQQEQRCNKVMGRETKSSNHGHTQHGRNPKPSTLYVEKRI